MERVGIITFTFDGPSVHIMGEQLIIDLHVEPANGYPNASRILIPPPSTTQERQAYQQGMVFGYPQAFAYVERALAAGWKLKFYNAPHNEKGSVATYTWTLKKKL